ncbi:MAG: metal ABC transporter permease [Verrucomicrobiota bacterium]
MIDFFQAVVDHSFLQRALLVGLLASLACGITGSYVVVKRMSFISGGIAHAVLGGMGIAYFFGAEPLIGAIPAAVLFALLIGSITLRSETGTGTDTAIGAVWAIGMAIGIIFVYKTPGYATNLFSYLFGNILMVTHTDTLLLLILDGLIVTIVTLFYKSLLAVSFDVEFARLQGVNVKLVYLTLLTLVALTVVVLVKVVGIVLVIALLTLPAALARQWTESLLKMMMLASVATLLFIVGGIAVAYPYNLPAGATIVLVAGSVFLLSTAVRVGR